VEHHTSFFIRLRCKLETIVHRAISEMGELVGTAADVKSARWRGAL